MDSLLDHLRGARILVVDDSDVGRHAMAESLLSCGAAVSMAVDGGQGLEQASTQDFDVVLLDVRLPDTTGYEIAEAMRGPAGRRARETGAKVVMLTGLIDQNAVVRALSAGADDFLQKPFSASELRHRVASLVRVRRIEERLRRLLEHRERMAAAAVHDLRGPLSALAANLAVIERAAVIDPALTGDMRAAVREMSQMLEEVLLTVRSEVASLRLTMKPIEPDRFLATVAERARRRYGPGGVSVEVRQEVDVAGGPVPLDHTLLGRVFDNLIRNAVQHGGTPAHITLSASGNEASCSFHVADEGRGLPVSDHRRLFDYMETGGHDSGGFGIGLMFCRAVAAAHGGEISAANQPRGGAVITVTIPREGRSA